MATRATETERKFRIEDGQQVPDLSELVRLGETERHRLQAVYYDTPDLLLARNRRTLRRRTGGNDAGWHLKLPGDGDSRTEVGLPLTTGSAARLVPTALREQVTDIIGAAPLVPVLELRTNRTETQLTGPRGGSLAMLCDDKVTAVRRGEECSWRELEVELTRGRVELLDRITARFAEAGVPVSESVSKLVQALGEQLAEADRPARPRKATAAQVIGAHLADQVGVIQNREADVRADVPDSVHKMRVATRRLRSALRTFRALMDREVTDQLRAELKWLAGMLGAPRDAEVLRDQLRGELNALPADSVISPVAERIENTLDEQHRRAHRELVKALDSARFSRLATSLLDLVTDPPFTDYAGARAKGVLPELLGRVDRRVAKAWRRARGLEGAEAEEAWHLTRKRAKAARYAWEASIDVCGDEAAAMAGAWEQVTETLGVVQDCVVIRERLRELAEAATAAGESSFTYGVLHQRLVEREESARGPAVAALKAARKLSNA
ncbi:CHAD domain containing protein [Enemella dayhoffiae]|uniref:CHAD domain containing protein n=1 Tax=Enemella dayhoffiae TaxID=2016507 RepID=A0A255GR52_9ACTN|nr:CYTH and CHAD domain-containing protein [Enemella dayhoffiae]OYO18061.1 CHAD domain containing protein [Enemella dayhoffiae]